MSDDEIRFHIVNLVQRQNTPNTLMGRSFAIFEPLIFNCWSSIGKTITEQWCASHLTVRTQGLNVVTAFAVNGHWIPLWFSPRGNMLQVHTFQSDHDFSLVEEIINFITDYLDFRTFAIHRIPDGLPVHMMCGAHAMAFIAHVVMNMPLPETLEELRTLHTNMRASFVAHLYAIDTTPRPVVWGNGPPGESRLLPKLPDETHIHALPEVHEQGFHLESGEGPSVLSTSQVFTSDHLGASCSGQSGQLPIMPVFADDRGDHHEGASSSVLSLPDVAQRPTIDAQVQKTCPIELERHARLLQITSHGYAMADDEIMFQLQHIAACQSDANPRQFIVLPPLHLIQWLHGDDAALHDWISRNRHWLGVEDHHVFTVLLHEQHWIPIWLAPGHGGMMAHTHTC